MQVVLSRFKEFYLTLYYTLSTSSELSRQNCCKKDDWRIANCCHGENDWQVLVGVSTGSGSQYDSHHTGNRLHVF